MKPRLMERSEHKSLAECDPALICHWHVYLLQHEQTKELYYGYTNDLSRRLQEHRRSGAWRLVYYEAYTAESDARARERSLKHYGQARAHVKHRLPDSLGRQISAGFNSPSTYFPG